MSASNCFCELVLCSCQLTSCFIFKVSPLCGFLCFKFPSCVLSSTSLLSCPFIGLLLFSSGFLITAFGYFLLLGLVVWFLLFPACPCNFCMQSQEMGFLFNMERQSTHCVLIKAAFCERCHIHQTNATKMPWKKLQLPGVKIVTVLPAPLFLLLFLPDLFWV